MFVFLLLRNIQAPCFELSINKNPSSLLSHPITIANGVGLIFIRFFFQNYENYRVIYINDASPDGTGALVEEYIKEKKRRHGVTLLQNETRVGKLANVYRAVHLCSPDEIIVELDGDDWLAHSKVLTKLNLVYQDPDIWMTYGQFSRYLGDPCERLGEEFPDEVIQENAFRSTNRGTTVLRTFYAGLFQQIKKRSVLSRGFFSSGL